eukprot:6996898-Lingulodinium_polyedra.AAC.1
MLCCVEENANVNNTSINAGGKAGAGSGAPGGQAIHGGGRFGAVAPEAPTVGCAAAATGDAAALD